MTAIQRLFHYSTINTTTLLLVFGVAVSACESSFETHDNRVKKAMREINYQDGISKQEAGTIADAYLILHGKYKGRASFARMEESDGVWIGKVLIAKSLASPIDANLPPVVVDKVSGHVSWVHGPALDRIDLDELDKAEPSVAVY